MAIFFRFFVILFAFFVACFAAGLVVAYGLLAPEFGKLSQSTPEAWLGFWFLAAAAGIVTPFYVFAPAVLIIFLSEMFSLRSVLFYGLMGGLVGALAYVLSDVTARMQERAQWYRSHRNCSSWSWRHRRRLVYGSLPDNPACSRAP
jgi:hypothetical protein